MSGAVSLDRLRSAVATLETLGGDADAVRSAARELVAHRAEVESLCVAVRIQHSMMAMMRGELAVHERLYRCVTEPAAVLAEVPRATLDAYLVAHGWTLETPLDEHPQWVPPSCSRTLLAADVEPGVTHLAVAVLAAEEGRDRALVLADLRAMVAPCAARGGAMTDGDYSPAIPRT